MEVATQHRLEFKFHHAGFINETIEQAHEFNESEEGLLADMLRQYMQFLVAVGFQPASVENVMEEIVQENSWSNKNA
jgi:hypothetical protein